MANKKPFKNISNSLAHIWGSPDSAQNQGGRATSAQRAGVKIDTPLTPDEKAAQRLADELAAEEKAGQKAADPRDPLEKRYDIHNREAHMTPEEFRALLDDSARGIQRLKEKVDVIHITDGQGLLAKFTFNAFNADENKDTKGIWARQIRNLGVSENLAYHNKVMVFGNGYLGLLEGQSPTNPLTRHFQALRYPDGMIMKHSTLGANSPHEVTFNIGNFSTIFKSPQDLVLVMQRDIYMTMTLTVTARRKRKDGPFEIGTLQHPDRAEAQTPRLEDISSAAFAQKDTIYYPYQNEGEFLSNFFNGAAGFRIILNDRPIAILLHDKPQLL